MSPPASAAAPISTESPHPRVEGLPLHTRSLTIAIRRDAEDRWHARGDIVDLRKNGFVPTHYDIQPSGIIHMMSIDLDFDPESLLILKIDVAQPFVAIEASEVTQGECCRDPAPLLQNLAGECLDEAFAKKLGLEFGGALGCSHLLTLFQLMASTVPHAVQAEADRVSTEGTHAALGDRFFRRSVFVDGAERSRASTDVVIQLADTHTRPLPSESRITERLASSHEIKTFASVDRKRFLLERLEVRERLRTDRSLGLADWTRHDSLLSSLVGERIIPGMAGRLFKLLGAEPAQRPILDSLLMFAPGFIQITAACMDDYFEARAETKDGDPSEKPAVANLGGNADSCYMWRRGGQIQKAWDPGG